MDSNAPKRFSLIASDSLAFGWRLGRFICRHWGAWTWNFLLKAWKLEKRCTKTSSFRWVKTQTRQIHRWFESKRLERMLPSFSVKCTCTCACGGLTFRQVKMFLRSPTAFISRKNNLTSISTFCWEACGYRFTHNGKDVNEGDYSNAPKAILVDC